MVCAMELLWDFPGEGLRPLTNLGETELMDISSDSDVCTNTSINTECCNVSLRHDNCLISCIQMAATLTMTVEVSNGSQWEDNTAHNSTKISFSTSSIRLSE